MFPSGGYLFSIFVVCAFLVCLCDGNIFSKKVHVRIINEVGEGLDLKAYCKSKDDDLGSHVIAPHLFYEFSFHPNFFPNTLFFCKFWWGNESHWFDIYNESRDEKYCDEQCWWQVKPTGPCFMTPTGVTDRCLPWNKDGHT